jgi:hypothetical protein
MKLAIAAAAALALALTASPVSAADSTSSSGATAEATWYFVQGDVAYGVHVVALIERDQLHQGGVQRTNGVNVQVLADYIDQATGEPVSALMVSEPYYTPASSLSIDLKGGASVRATVVVETPPELAAAGGGGGGGPHLGPFTLDVAVDWTPTGGVTHTYSSIWDTEFGVKSLKRKSIYDLDADAKGSIGGDPILGTQPFGDLGVTPGLISTAKLFQLTQFKVSSLAVASMLNLAGRSGTSTTWFGGAFANWAMADERSTQILFTVEQDLQNNGPHSAPFAYSEIIQGWCDTATNEVINLDASSPSAPATSGYVDSNIQGAAGAATMTLEGYLARTPNCDDPQWDQQVFEPFGPATLTVSGSWTATSGPSFVRSLFREVSPTGATKAQELNRGRLAAATGAVSGDLANGPLTEVVNAFLYNDRTRVTG